METTLKNSAQRGADGLTMTETVVASFLLLAVFAVTATLFHSAIRYSLAIEEQVTANRIGQSTLTQVRSWSSTYDNWALLQATYSPQTISLAPYKIVITSGAPSELASPCHSLEAAYPLANRKLLKNSIRPVQVDVEWNSNRLSLNTLIAEPRRTLGSPPSLPVSAIGGIPPSPIAKSGKVNFDATLRDSSNKVIPDVFLKWYTFSETGDGTVASSDRLGSAATFTHHVRLPGTPTSYGFSPGTGPAGNLPSSCAVKARAFYYGVEVFGVSSDLSLQP